MRNSHNDFPCTKKRASFYDFAFIHYYTLFIQITIICFVQRYILLSYDMIIHMTFIIDI